MCLSACRCLCLTCCFGLSLLLGGLSSRNVSAADPPVGVLAPSGDAIAMTDQVKAAVAPLFDAIHEAKSIRSIAEMKLVAAVKGEPVETQSGTYQILSAAPNRVSAVLKGPDQVTQMVSDGKLLNYALTPEAYIELEAPKSLDSLASNVETPFGPFPEYILSLTLAGTDAYPAFFRTAAGMGISDGEREKLPGTVRVHVRRGDGVVWDMWIRKGDQPAPVRLAVDITGMLVKMNQLQIPEGFSYVLEINFKSWETDTKLDENVFAFQPKAAAEKFESLDAFLDSLSTPAGPHPLLGQAAPAFTSTLLDGQKFDLKQHRDKQVVVLDFWATWCGPCVEALPMIAKTTGRFADQDVVFYAVNVGEEEARIREFLKQQELDPAVLMDPEGEIADAYGATAIPQTVLIGKDGRVEAVHVGFSGPEAMAKILTAELTALAKGERLAEEEDSEQ
ncbi:redoxin domain-containing protein [Roseimaritima ulvae]|uniref:Thiol-disulfide oxidoreductase ResA n=1 Tax=Roseimaritima ulvae TaxID=980254 RepID=A0A5B9QKM8_9BACT|nr:redoxin domain-containing protein [Roseimaritima ulvae]QEG38549.1 Thiol-disulfide oxidoreductase ResA [Roseimaritima ulvae]